MFPLVRLVQQQNDQQLVVWPSIQLPSITWLRRLPHVRQDAPCGLVGLKLFLSIVYLNLAFDVISYITGRSGRWRLLDTSYTIPSAVLIVCAAFVSWFQKVAPSFISLQSFILSFFALPASSAWDNGHAFTTFIPSDHVFRLRCPRYNHPRMSVNKQTPLVCNVFPADFTGPGTSAKQKFTLLWW